MLLINLHIENDFVQKITQVKYINSLCSFGHCELELLVLHRGESSSQVSPENMFLSYTPRCKSSYTHCYPPKLFVASRFFNIIYNSACDPLLILFVDVIKKIYALQNITFAYDFCQQLSISCQS
jgi:hypothetical protein